MDFKRKIYKNIQYSGFSGKEKKNCSFIGVSELKNKIKKEKQQLIETYHKNDE